MLEREAQYRGGSETQQGSGNAKGISGLCWVSGRLEGNATG